MRQSGSFVSAATILAVAAMLIWFGLRPAISTILASPASTETAEFQAGAGAGLLGADGSAAGQLSARGDAKSGRGCVEKGAARSPEKTGADRSAR